MKIQYVRAQSKTVVLFLSLLCFLSSMGTECHAEETRKKTIKLKTEVYSVRDDFDSINSLGTSRMGVGEIRFSLPLFTVMLTAKLAENNRYQVTVGVTSDSKTFIPELETQMFSFSDLTPQSVALGHDIEKNRYRVNLVPYLNNDTVELVQASDATIQWSSWHLPDSPVILNDEKYIGRTHVSGANLFFLYVPQVALIHCSLLPFSDSECLGILTNGLLEIKGTDGNRICIFNVCNGRYPATLEGGPYKVWVDWFAYTDFKTLSDDELSDILHKHFPHSEENLLTYMKMGLQKGIMISGIRPLGS